MSYRTANSRIEPISVFQAFTILCVLSLHIIDEIKLTGLVVCCQNERSQHQNKATAIAVLQSRLMQLYKDKKHDQKVQSTIGVG